MLKAFLVMMTIIGLTLLTNGIDVLLGIKWVGTPFMFVLAHKIIYIFGGGFMMFVIRKKIPGT